jgi:class 3 adenylate cyclase/pimeloyl-ACP methyl ester carboxylesterase
VTSIHAWLAGLGLEHYAEAFARNDIDFAVLADLTDADLEKLGVSMGNRKRLLKAIQALAQSGDGFLAPSPAPTDFPTGAERRQLTVMFCDLVGSVALSQRLDPEELRGLIQAYRAACAGVIQRYEGYIARYVGDGILTYFGWPKAHEDDAERSVRAALEIVSAVKSVPASPPLSVHIGIATGPVVVGEQAGESPEAKLAVGTTPNLAARLQGLAESDQVVIGATTRKLLGSQFDFVDLGLRHLKGLEEPVQVWQAKSAVQVEDRFTAARTAEYLTPLVGRREEIALLMRRWEQAKDAEGQVVLLSGDAGIGKSRVVHELVELARQSHNIVIASLQCSPFHRNSSYYPLLSYIGRSAGFDAADTSDTKLAKLRAWLATEHVSDQNSLTDTVAFVANALGIVHGECLPASSLSAPMRKEKTLDTLAKCVVEEASGQTTLLVVEDAQWADPSTLDTLDMIVGRARNAPLLVLVTFRPDFVHRWSSYPYVTLLPLGPLTRREALTMAQLCTASRGASPDLLAEMVAKTDGVPLFIEEVSHGLNESQSNNSDARASEPLAQLPIPTTVRDALTARLDRLTAATKETAQIAAVIGREFERDLVAAVSSLSEVELDEALTQMVASGLVHRSGGGTQSSYAFNHGLVQELAYETLLKSRRQELHRSIATQIEQRFPHVSNSQPEILAHHYFHAGELMRSAELWLRAAVQAKTRLTLTEATQHALSGLKAITALGQGKAQASDLKVELLTLLGDLESLLSRLDDANRYYRDAAGMIADEQRRILVENRLHHPKSVTRGGARIAYFEHGTGDDTILFVNPIAYALGTFQPIVERLCHEFKLVTVHCRGAGASDPLERPYRTNDHMEDLATVIRDIGKPVIGVGISRGGNILTRLAVRSPELIKKLVLVGCPLCDFMDTTNPFPLDEAYCGKRNEFYEAKNLEALVRLHMELVFSEPVTNQMREQSIRTILALPNETVMSFFDLDRELDIRAELSKIMAPTLVAHGTEDRVVPLGNGLLAHRQIPGARFYEFTGKGHLPMFSAMDEFCELLRDFARSGTRL